MKRNSLLPLSLGVIGIGLLLQGCASTGGGAGETVSNGGGARDKVVAAALSQIGTRYKYGAQSPGKALDCSALTQHAYRVAGVRIPRVSTDQRRAATPVQPAKAQPGDLVFFKMRRGLHHVGLMVDDKRFVHASTSKKRVRLSSIDSNFWQRHLIGAGTYLN
jgi:cell wall-associated NlpC family hydrolase